MEDEVQDVTQACLFPFRLGTLLSSPPVKKSNSIQIEMRKVNRSFLLLQARVHWKHSVIRKINHPLLNEPLPIIFFIVYLI